MERPKVYFYQDGADFYFAFSPEELKLDPATIAAPIRVQDFNTAQATQASEWFKEWCGLFEAERVRAF